MKYHILKRFMDITVDFSMLKFPVFHIRMKVQSAVILVICLTVTIILDIHNEVVSRNHLLPLIASNVVWNLVLVT